MKSEQFSLLPSRGSTCWQAKDSCGFWQNRFRFLVHRGWTKIHIYKRSPMTLSCWPHCEWQVCDTAVMESNAVGVSYLWGLQGNVIVALGKLTVMSLSFLYCRIRPRALPHDFCVKTQWNHACKLLSTREPRETPVLLGLLYSCSVYLSPLHHSSQYSEHRSLLEILGSKIPEGGAQQVAFSTGNTKQFNVWGLRTWVQEWGTDDLRQRKTDKQECYYWVSFTVLHNSPV